MCFVGRSLRESRVQVHVTELDPLLGVFPRHLLGPRSKAITLDEPLHKGGTGSHGDSVMQGPLVPTLCKHGIGVSLAHLIRRQDELAHERQQSSKPGTDGCRVEAINKLLDESFLNPPLICNMGARDVDELTARDSG